MAGFGFGNGGTEFLSMLPPPGDALREYDNTRHFNEQAATIPQIFRDALSVREEVYGDQGVPLEAEFDEDDARSWHWVVYASVGGKSSASSPSSNLGTPSPSSKADDARRASATASRVPVGTIRLIPPPHGPNRYVRTALPRKGDRHSDADPPYAVAHVDKTHPTEPYIKLGRLAVLPAYRSLGLSKLLVNTVLDYASKHPESIHPPPPPTTLELANLRGKVAEDAVLWKGLAMVHAQVSVAPLWKKHGFAEELVNDKGGVEVSKEERWKEEGIEHMGMWKRLNVDHGRL